jgi:hypothetical protein
MADWLLECSIEDSWEPVLWSEFYKTLKNAKAAAEEDVIRKMGNDRGMDQDWLREGITHWNSCSNLSYTIIKVK